jgi:hypothetical protein
VSKYSGGYILDNEKISTHKFLRYYKVAQLTQRNAKIRNSGNQDGGVAIIGKIAKVGVTQPSENMST